MLHAYYVCTIQSLLYTQTNKEEICTYITPRNQSPNLGETLHTNLIVIDLNSYCNKIAIMFSRWLNKAFVLLAGG